MFFDFGGGFFSPFLSFLSTGFTHGLDKCEVALKVLS